MAPNKRYFNVLVRLDCLHVQTFPKPAPKMGDIVYCLKCGEYCEVIHAPSEFSVVCRTCPYARQLGAARINAQLAADKHARRYPHHLVELYNGNKRIESRKPKPVQLTIDSVELPPF